MSSITASAPEERLSSASLYAEAKSLDLRARSFLAGPETGGGDRLVTAELDPKELGSVKGLKYGWMVMDIIRGLRFWR